MEEGPGTAMSEHYGEVHIGEVTEDTPVVVLGPVVERGMKDVTWFGWGEGTDGS
jgi:hypothetical protein